MIVPALLAALAVIPTISAQSTSTTTVFATSTRTDLPCSTSSEAYPLVIFGVTTSFTVSNTVLRNTTLPPSTYFSTPTVVVTRDATTITNVVTETKLATVTNTIVPPTVTVKPSPGWLPLQGSAAAPSATPLPRFRRGQLDARSSLMDVFKRDPEDIWGYIASPNNGSALPIQKKWIHAVFCPVEIITNTTVEYYVTSPAVTSVQQATASAASTSTVTTTTSTVVYAPTPTFYAACQSNNIVNHIDYDVNGRPMYFDRIFFRRPSRNNTDVNEIGVDATSPTDCCIKCQTAPEGCAEAFFAPGEGKCRMRLRRPIIPALGSLPSALPLPSGYAAAAPALATAAAGVDVNKVCPLGSLTEYVGEIHGQEGYEPAFAFSFINGPCGRLSVDTVPLDRPQNASSNSTGTGGPTAVPLPRPTGAVGRAVRLLSG